MAEHTTSWISAVFFISVICAQTVTAQVTVTVSPITSSGTATAGESYSLECTVTVTGSNDQPTITWLMGPMDNQMMITSGVVTTGSSMSTLTFGPLSASDAGTYTCRATLGSAMDSASTTITVQIPNPVVMITSSPIPPVGSTVTLTCTVDLSPSVDIPVTVTAQISAPMGVTITPVTNSVMESTTRYTSTATVGPFGRIHSGEYTCMANVRLVTANPFIIGGSGVTGMARITVGTGVYLSLRGVVYANNSAIQITEIGETNAMSNNGLQCITDRMPCCVTLPNRHGDWLFPDGTTVPGPAQNPTTFYRNRGDDGTVNLNRLNTNVMMPTGLFCCELPDATGVTQRICADIGAGVNVRITGSGATPALGQRFSLTCEVSGASSPVSAYQWRRGDTVLSQTGQTLSFSSLSLSDSGQYTCQVTVDGMMFSRTEDIRLTIPSTASVSVTSIPSSPVYVTSTVTVSCTVELNSAIIESDLSLLMVSAQLTHPNGTILSLSNTMTGTTFTYTTRFERSDSGRYTCTATISPQPTAIYLSGTDSETSAVEITTIPGVYLTLEGQHYGNGSHILIDEIGEGDGAALLCVTDLVQCCRGDNTPGVGGPLGNWFYPNRSLIRLNGSNDDFYRSRGLGSVRLNRRNNAMSPIGQFCCVVPDATFVDKTTCINIVLDLPTTSYSLPTPTVPSSRSSRTCSSDVGIAVGGLILVEGIIAAVAAIIVTVICWRRKSGKSDFAVSANIAYGQVTLGGLGDAGGEYEDPDKLARSGRGGGGGGGNYEPTGCPAPYEFPVSKPEAPVHATADDNTNSGKITV